LSNLSPVARGPVDGMDCLQNQDCSTCNRNNTDWSGYKDACAFTEEPQSCQLNLELVQSVRRFTEFRKHGIGAIRKDSTGMAGII